MMSQVLERDGITHILLSVGRDELPRLLSGGEVHELITVPEEANSFAKGKSLIVWITTGQHLEEQQARMEEIRLLRIEGQQELTFVPCPICHGQCVNACEVCGGSGRDTVCVYCQGSGIAACPRCHGAGEVTEPKSGEPRD